MNIPRAVNYAHLIGRYVRAEAPGTPEQPDGWGGSGVVFAVWDAVQYGVRGVEVMFDYGMGFFVTAANEREWNFGIALQEEVYPSDVPGAGSIEKSWRQSWPR